MTDKNELPESLQEMFGDLISAYRDVMSRGKSLVINDLFDMKAQAKKELAASKNEDQIDVYSTFAETTDSVLKYMKAIYPKEYKTVVEFRTKAGKAL